MPAAACKVPAKSLHSSVMPGTSRASTARAKRPPQISCSGAYGKRARADAASSFALVLQACCGRVVERRCQSSRFAVRIQHDATPSLCCLYCSTLPNGSISTAYSTLSNGSISTAQRPAHDFLNLTQTRGKWTVYRKALPQQPLCCADSA